MMLISGLRLESKSARMQVTLVRNRAVIILSTRPAVTFPAFVPNMWRITHAFVYVVIGLERRVPDVAARRGIERLQRLVTSALVVCRAGWRRERLMVRSAAVVWRSSGLFVDSVQLHFRPRFPPLLQCDRESLVRGGCV